MVHVTSLMREACSLETLMDNPKSGSWNAEKPFVLSTVEA